MTVNHPDSYMIIFWYLYFRRDKKGLGDFASNPCMA